MTLRQALAQRCDLFIENTAAIKQEFRWESLYIPPLCAGIITSRGLPANTQAMRYCLEILKGQTSLFSNFRGVSKMATVTMLSLSSHPEQQLTQMLTVHDHLKRVFWGSAYLPVAAAAIAQLAEPRQYEEIAGRTRRIYNGMKTFHPFLTSSEDSPFAALLALSGLEEEVLLQESEKCYASLKPFFFSGNAVQSLSQVLALGGGPAEQKCRRVLDIWHTLKNRGHKYGTTYELATLGVLALLEEETSSLCEDMIEVDHFLKMQKGFGAFGVGRTQRMMYAGILTMSDSIPALQTMQIAALNGVVSLIVAQQAAICASVAATSAAAASSASS